ncbi:MAG: four-carbon acid sugar kinase family protein [Vampirovibrionales bacterium]|nr:four-carbon acid sugar kinase family protein [Vampirovibrionales bacterium]
MQLPGLNIGIVADDMTGASDTALQFFLAGLPTHVLLDLNTLEERVSSGLSINPQTENHVWSLNADSRHLEKGAADKAIRKAVSILRDQYGVENFYKKMDSTLRGHIAAECLAMLDELDADCAVVVPAFPQEGRRTVGGYQLVRGMPVERTQVVRDPLFPVRQSHIPTLLGQATTPEIVGHISLSTVLHGAGPILVALSELIQDGKKLVVIDATSNEDLEQIALAIDKIRNKAQQQYHVLPCGSAGLAQALTKLWADKFLPDSGDSERAAKNKHPLTFVPSPLLIVAGSSTDTTRQQVLQLIENYAYYAQGSNLSVFQLTSEQLLGLVPLTELMTQINLSLDEENSTVVLASALKEDQYARTLLLAKEHEIPEKQASRMVQETLAKVAASVINQSQNQVKLVLTGGETASKVCQALHSQTLKLLDEAQPSVPVCLDDKGHWIITKSGNFGEPMLLAKLVRFVKDHETLAASQA